MCGFQLSEAAPISSGERRASERNGVAKKPSAKTVEVVPKRPTLGL